jgi:hypothetical protein
VKDNAGQKLASVFEDEPGRWLKFFTHASLGGDGQLEFQTRGATKGLLSASAPDKQKDASDESRNAMIP